MLLALALFIPDPAQADVTLQDGEYILFHHTDSLGSPLAVSDHAGRVLWYEQRDPYGRGRDRITHEGRTFYSDRTQTRTGYTGHAQDTGAELTYMKARYYDPTIGRFFSNDPVGFTLTNNLSFNRYTYANNNPYLYIDPDGRYASDHTAETFSELSERDKQFATGDYDDLAPWADYAANHNHGDADGNTNPIVPPGADLGENIGAADAQIFPNLYWFWKRVKNGGPWDYKMHAGVGYEAFGNFNYGATGNRVGISDGMLLNEAGKSQENGNPQDRNVVGSSSSRLRPGSCKGTCGDQPWDHFMIHQGIQYGRVTR